MLPVRVRIIVIASAILELTWLKEERRRRKKKDRRFDCLETCRCGTPAMVSSNANSLFTDENTRESLVWFIKACGYI